MGAYREGHETPGDLLIVGSSDSHHRRPGGATLAIGGMTCGACAARIERRLNALEGVEASVNLATERARILLPDTVTIERVTQEIAAIGFTAAVVDHAQPADDGAADQRVRALGLRLTVAAAVFMPLCDLSISFSVGMFPRFAYWQWILILLAAPVVSWAAWPFYEAALRNARHRTVTMDTLVSVGIVSSTLWSLYAMFWQPVRSISVPTLLLPGQHYGGAVYLDVGAGVTTFLLCGRYFEARSRRRSGNALRSLAAVGAKQVAVLDEAGYEHLLAVSDMAVGDRFVVRPGETIATDGEVVAGRSWVDQGVLTGESAPVDVELGGKVVGGTVVVDGQLVVRATRVGDDTQLAGIVRLVEDAQNQKAAVQRLADRIASVFVPAVVALALVTLASWLATGHASADAFAAALSVLIIACPCALGLATPTALLVATGRGARMGIFFKGYQGIEVSRSVDTVVFDKTGTLTAGQMAVGDMVTDGIAAETALRWAAAVEQGSEHPIGRAIVEAACADGEPLPTAEGFRVAPGRGAAAILDGREVFVGRVEGAAPPATIAARSAQWEAAGSTAVFVAIEGRVVAALRVTDTVRPSARPAVERLTSLGLDCILLTGDNEATAAAVARAVGIGRVIAGALPAEKMRAIRDLQHEGRCVAMVGDGINDGPSLAAADLGMAVGTGTDVARNAADLILLSDDLTAVADGIQLARDTIRTIRTNLVWAFAYNLAALPVAALGLLNPLIAGAAMTLSSTFVVFNSARLQGRPSQAHTRNQRSAPVRAPVPTAGQAEHRINVASR